MPICSHLVRLCLLNPITPPFPSPLYLTSPDPLSLPFLFEKPESELLEPALEMLRCLFSEPQRLGHRAGA